MLFDPVTKRRIELKDEGDLLVVRETVPKDELRKILEHNKQEYNAIPHKQYKSALRKDSTRMWKPASIPTIIVEKWKREEGLDLFNEEHWPRIREKLNLHVIRFNRSSDVIQDVMGKSQAEVWVSDCWNGQLKAPAHQRQLCLAHQLRNLQAVVDLYPLAFWPRAMQALFRSAVKLQEQRQKLPPGGFDQKVRRLERLCDRLLQRPLTQNQAAKLQRRYLKHRHSLLVFLYRTDVDPTNYRSERALRPSVIAR